MDGGILRLTRRKKIESFKYSYVHTLKVKRGKKLGLQKRSTKTRIETQLGICTPLCLHPLGL
jgi:hypothetical protein